MIICQQNLLHIEQLQEKEYSKNISTKSYAYNKKFGLLRQISR